MLSNPGIESGDGKELGYHTWQLSSSIGPRSWRLCHVMMGINSGLLNNIYLSSGWDLWAFTLLSYLPTFPGEMASIVIVRAYHESQTMLANGFSMPVFSPYLAKTTWTRPAQPVNHCWTLLRFIHFQFANPSYLADPPPPSYLSITALIPSISYSTWRLQLSYHRLRFSQVLHMLTRPSQSHTQVSTSSPHTTKYQSTNNPNQPSPPQ